MVRLAENVEVGGIPEEATIPDLNDVVDLGGTTLGHVSLTVGSGTSTTISKDDQVS